MATACLNRVSAALRTPAAVDVLREPFRGQKVDKKAATTEVAPQALSRLRELLKVNHGISIGKINNKEIVTVVEGVNIKDDNSITSQEYEEMMETVVKYASLRARRSPRTRFIVGVLCSAASAVAIVAATAAVSAGVMVAAAPVGAALGAIAVGASSLGSTKRDKKRAAKHIPSVPADSASESSAAANAARATTAGAVGVQGQLQPTTPPADTARAGESPSAHTALLISQTSPTSDDLVSAVVEVSSARPTAAAAAKQTPFSAVTQIPLFPNITDGSAPAAAHAGTSSAVPDASHTAVSDDADFQPLPELLLSPSPNPPASDAGAEDSVQELLTPAISLDVTRSADLPPLAKKNKPSPSKKLKKSLSKGYKSFKNAISISSSSDLESAAAAAVARADRDTSSTPFAGKPPSGFSFRRSFSRDSAKDMSGEGLTVQGSEGSATLRKMKEVLRRSFTLSTPRNSMDISSGARAHAV